MADNINDINFRDLNQEGAEFNSTLSSISSTINQLIRDNKTLATNFGIQNSTLKSTRDLAKDLSSVTQDLIKDQKSLNLLESNIQKTKKEAKILSQELLVLNTRMKSATIDEQTILAQIITQKQEQLDTTNQLLNSSIKLNNTVKSFRDNLETSKNSGVVLFKSLSSLVESSPFKFMAKPFQAASQASQEAAAYNLKHFGQVKGMTKEQEKMLKTGRGLTQEKIKEMGFADKLIDKNGNILAGTAASAKARALGLTKTMSPLQAGIKAIGPALKKAFGPVAIILELIKAIVKADEEITELGKAFTLSKNEAAVLRSELTTAALRSHDNFITTTQLINAQQTLNKELGLTVHFSGDTLVTASKLLEKVKLQGDAVAGLAAQSVVAGESFDENYKNALATAYQFQVQTGRTADLRKVMNQVGQVTGALRAQLGGSTIEITKAVANAETLGMNMKEVAAAGRQLLNFEDSITKELEAELLLGKQINLERARAAALAGDQVTLQNELQKNIGSFSEFTKMNVLQQEALAAAMGMTSDQISDILFKQEIQGKTAKELRALGKDELAARLEATTAQDKFNAVMTKLQGILADIVTPLIPLLDTVMSVLDPIFSLLRLLNPILKLTSLIVTAITDTVKTIGSIFGIGEGGFDATFSAAEQLGESIMNDSVPGMMYQGMFGDNNINNSPNTQPIVIQNTFSNFQSSGPYALAETQRRQASPTFA
jgi:hypothetical protein